MRNVGGRTLGVGFQPFLERETRIYLGLNPGLTAAQISAVNTNIRAIKYGAGYTVASATLNISNVLNYYFLTNHDVDADDEI